MVSTFLYIVVHAIAKGSISWANNSSLQLAKCLPFGLLKGYINMAFVVFTDTNLTMNFWLCLFHGNDFIISSLEGLGVLWSKRTTHFARQKSIISPSKLSRKLFFYFNYVILSNWSSRVNWIYIQQHPRTR